MSYTTFYYSNLQIAKEASTSDESINLSFEVENTGKVVADEIAQIYISSTKDDQPIRHIQLQGFARIPLQPGERKTIRVKLYVEQFGYYSNTGQRQWNIAPGTYTVKVGASSADIKLSENVTLKGTPVSKPLREFYFSESTVELSDSTSANKK